MYAECLFTCDVSGFRKDQLDVRHLTSLVLALSATNHVAGMFYLLVQLLFLDRTFYSIYM